MRPFGSSFLFIGWDKIYGYQLYQSDPSGNYAGWKATSIGANSGTVQSIFKSDFKDEGINLDNAKEMIFKIFSKTFESSSLNHEKVELAIFERKQGKSTLNFANKAEIENYITLYADKKTASHGTQMED